jgi:hypothetical protein
MGTGSQLVALKGAIGRGPGLGVDLEMVSPGPCPGQGGESETGQSEHCAHGAEDDGQPSGVIIGDGKADRCAGVCCVRRGECGWRLRK